MNKAILNTEVQAFINSNLKSDVAAILLKSTPFNSIDAKSVVEQIEAKKRCEKKLPTWFKTANIYYPNKLNIEQSSSELTALYKSKLVSGDTLIDLTGGYGVDAFYFSKTIAKVTHCEINDELSHIAQHNYEALQSSNITCLKESGIDALKRMDESFDWIYIDPSRRDSAKNKVFLLTDCVPNVKTFQGLFLKYSKNLMIKSSPLLDIKATTSDLRFVKELHIVAVNNEVKELLWILERDYTTEFKIKTVNITKSTNQVFEFQYKEEASATVTYSKPLSYLYEPNAAILKAGAFNSISALLKVAKLHKHSHLYTSNSLIDFPGRRFKIEKAIPFNKKEFSKARITKANITTRNFPLSVHNIRKKLNVKDGGDHYLFFTTNTNNAKIVLLCSKV